MNKQVNELVWANRAMVIEWAMANPEVKGEAIYWAMLGEDKLNAMADAIGGWGLDASEECDAIEAMADEVINLVEEVHSWMACTDLANLVEAIGAECDNQADTLNLATMVARGAWTNEEISQELARQLADW